MSLAGQGAVLVTGGAGYIGSHAAVALHEAGYDPALLDNLVNSNTQAVEAVRALCQKEVPFFEIDCCDIHAVREVFDTMKRGGNPIVGVIHFAAHKAVGESVEHPAMYAHNNVGSLGAVLQVMAEFDVHRMVFSSSCTVYGNPDLPAVTEATPLQEAESPYGWTKQACERVLGDHARVDPRHRVALLRYFNPVGAHPSALLGELPLGTPNNLVPFLTQTVAGIHETLTVFGDDYDTADGTCIRDYLHVMDLAEAHVKALKWCRTSAHEERCRAFNLGSGSGASVLEVIRTFEAATGLKVPFRMGERRPGDVVAIWADPSRALAELGWRTKRSLKTALADAWRWQTAQKSDNQTHA
mgnify:FL=1